MLLIPMEHIFSSDKKVKIKQRKHSRIIDYLGGCDISTEYQRDSELKFSMSVGIYIWKSNEFQMLVEVVPLSHSSTQSLLTR